MKRTGRCLCGIKIAYHYDADNRQLSCAQAALAHPRAKVARRSLRVLLCNAGAVPTPKSYVTGLRQINPSSKVAGVIMGATS